MARFRVRRSLLASSALVLLGRAVAVPAAAPASDRAAEIPLPASDGLPVLAAAPAARATWIDFWASWCTPCRLAFPWMNEMHDRLGPQGLRIVAVNLDRRLADAQRFLQQTPARFALAFDAEATTARVLAVQAMPSSFLVGPDRRLLLAHRGFRLEDREPLEQRLRAALETR